MIEIRVGTRKSALAMAQAEHVCALIRALQPDIKTSIIPMLTTGDKLLDANLATQGGKGLFLKELESALLDDKIDIAVHSLKDVPTKMREGLFISCILEREDPNDVLVSDKWSNLEELPLRARVGTSSLRRKHQLLMMRPDLEVVNLRGNVLTRLEKMSEGVVDACVLAYAGMKRLGLEDEIKQIFTVGQMIPASGQGSLCIQMADDKTHIHNLISVLDHPESHKRALAERGFMSMMDGDCSMPLAVHASMEGGGIRVDSMFYHEAKGKLFYASHFGSTSDPALVGIMCSAKLKEESGW